MSSADKVGQWLSLSALAEMKRGFFVGYVNFCFSGFPCRPRCDTEHPFAQVVGVQPSVKPLLENSSKGISFHPGWRDGFRQ